MERGNPLDDLASRLAEAVPKPIRDAQHDLEKNFRAVLENAFQRLDLVTREEFDVQRAVLARTREKVETLEQRVAELEAELGVGHRQEPDASASGEEPQGGS